MDQLDDPLTILLDQVWLEAHWQMRLAQLRQKEQRKSILRKRVPDEIQDSLAGRNQFWIEIMEGAK